MDKNTKQVKIGNSFGTIPVGSPSDPTRTTAQTDAYFQNLSNQNPESADILMDRYGYTNSPNIITPKSLEPVTPIQGLPTTPVTTEAPKPTPIDYDAMFGLTDFQKQAEQTQETGISEIIKNMGLLQNEATDLQAERQKQGLQDKYKENQATKARVLALDAEMQQDDIVLAQKMRNEERRDTLLPFAQMGQAKLAGDAAIYRGLKTAEKNTLISQQLAQQGDIALAEQFAKDAIDAKYAPYKQNIENYKTILEIIKPSLTAAENKRLKAQESKVASAENEIKKAEENEKAIEKMLLDATPNAPASVIANAKTIKDNGGSSLEVAQALGKYGGDYLKTELLKQQIETEKAQRSNINANRRKIEAETGLLGTSGGGKPPTEGQILNAGYADRIKLANDIVDSKTETFKNMNYVTFKLLESKSQIANKLLTPDQRQAAQALRNFITAKLRKESGAAISQTEFDDARLQYFPSLGDDEQTLRNKKVLRESVLDNLIIGSGSAYKATPIDTYFNSVTGSVESVNNQINNKEKSFLMSLPQTP